MTKMFRFPPVIINCSETGSEPIQLFRVGSFTHPQYGKFEITSQMLADIKSNFDNRVRGIDIAVDYKHDSDDVAAGWIKELYLSDDGNSLFGKVDWTPNGNKILSDKEFRYISPEFTLDYQDNETLKKFGPVLLGAGLTNRPVIKKMEPVVELSEIAAGQKEQSKGDSKMLPEKKMGDMSPEEMMAMIEALKAELAKVKGEHESMMADKKCAEKKAQFTKLLSEGKACAAQEESWMQDDMVKFAELSQPVKLSEEGSRKEPEVKKEELPVDEQIHKLAEKLVADKIVKSLSEAYVRVLSENESLRKQKYAN